jgi:hypothetical protein
MRRQILLATLLDPPPPPPPPGVLTRNQISYHYSRPHGLPPALGAEGLNSAGFIGADFAARTTGPNSNSLTLWFRPRSAESFHHPRDATGVGILGAEVGRQATAQIPL